MDPLHKTDSAISVASKDNDVYDELSAYHQHQPPPSKRLRPDDDSQNPASFHQPSTTPQPESSPQESLAPVTRPSVAPTIANLISPPDESSPPAAHGSPSLPPYEHAGSPPLAHQQPATTQTHRADPWTSTDYQHPYSPHQSSEPIYAPPTAGGDQYDQDSVQQAGNGNIIVDEDELESDPGYESDRASFASTSLSSSARDYLFENGRRYHRFREGRYNFPNDEAEQDREDMKHACVKMLCQQLYFAPLDDRKVHNVLDIGTGTGIWAIEMGDQFPAANVTGIDLSPIQPDWVPSNVHFVVDDAESEWLYPEDHFDYIHSRHTVMAIKDWPKLYKQAMTHLKPGGWIESQEIYHYPISANNSMPPDHPIAQYWGLIKDGLAHLGVDFHAAAGGKIANAMHEAGFVNIHERVLHVPIGTWAKHPNLKMVGEYWRQVLLDGAQAIALGPLTRGCGWTRDQVEVFLVDVRKAYFDNLSLMYMPMHIVCGQKPGHGF
ncbi:methyltransferase [Diaporthe amygdali]|uniref:methyltransferase n=1 Tax=Phomopsis amygdali TaxID=1214568 RepID=UPI0022FDC0D1|nr:methyltransferase [Diaporthe amygdali]KAJ0122913.1 methyltransferase [Diaporthe amygdali]